MKLVEMKIGEYIDLLSSDAPAPGGGSASALSGVQGISLGIMVANLTLGRKKYAQFESLCKQTIDKGNLLKEKMLKLMDDDTRAYSKVMEAFRLPKGTEEDKVFRRKTIDKAMVEATKVPFSLLETAFEAIKIVEMLVGNSNTNAASDLGVACADLSACAKGAYLNVKINAPGLKDQALGKDFLERGREILKKAEEINLRVYSAVEKMV